MESQCVICLDKGRQKVCLYDKCTNSICNKCYCNIEFQNNIDYYVFWYGTFRFCSIQCIYEFVFQDKRSSYITELERGTTTNAFLTTRFIRSHQIRAINSYEIRKSKLELNKIFIKDLTNIICEYLLE